MVCSYVATGAHTITAEDPYPATSKTHSRPSINGSLDTNLSQTQVKQETPARECATIASWSGAD